MAGLDRETVRALSRRSDRAGARRFAAHLGLLGLTGITIALAGDGFWRWPSMFLHGVVLIFLFAPLHECVHRTAFRSRAWNDRVARFCGFVILLPPRWFRAFHLAHHRHTQDPDRDPELRTRKPRSWGGFLWLASGGDYWLRSVRGLLRRAAGRVTDPFVTRSERPFMVAEARRFLLAYGLLAGLGLATGMGGWLWQFWVLPALLGQPVLRLFLFAEHWGCPPSADMWANTRTTISNPALRFLAWNMPYHAEHHAWPGVPFHALPDLHRRAGELRQVTVPGYAVFYARDAAPLVRDGTGI